MRLVSAAFAAIVLCACSSENTLKDEPDAGLGTTTEGVGPGQTTSTTDTPSTPGTDTPPTPDTADTGWDWTPDTGTPGTGTGTGGTGTGTGEPGTGTGTGEPGTGSTIDTGLTDEQICTYAASLAGYLDRYQTAGDGHVLYCHSSGGSNWTFVDSNISSCLPHLNHAYDVFPTTGCDS